MSSFLITNTYYLFYLLGWLYRRPLVSTIESNPIFYAYDTITIKTKNGNIDKVRCLFDKPKIKTIPKHIEYESINTNPI
jgi:hypothetical protein